MRVFVLPVQIGFGDCDPAGIVFYPNYYRWFDAATHAMFAAVGHDFRRFRRERGAVAWPLVDTGARFVAPAIAGERIEIHSSIAHWSGRAFRIEHRVLREGQVIVEGFEVRILAEIVGDDHWSGKVPTFRAIHMPDELRQAFE